MTYIDREDHRTLTYIDAIVCPIQSSPALLLSGVVCAGSSPAPASSPLMQEMRQKFEVIVFTYSILT